MKKGVFYSRNLKLRMMAGSQALPPQTWKKQMILMTARMTRKMTPATGTMIVQTTMSTAQLILIAASLSFLGLGVQLPTPEWGALLSEAREYMRTAPYLMVFPGIFMILTSLSLNLLGDGLRDALDPKLKS